MPAAFIFAISLVHHGNKDILQAHAQRLQPHQRPSFGGQFIKQRLADVNPARAFYPIGIGVSVPGRQSLDRCHIGTRFQHGKHLFLRAADFETITVAVFDHAVDVFGFFIRHHPAFIDNDDPVADRLYFLQNMRGKNDRVISAQRPDEIPDLDDLFRVKSHRGFIKNDDRRISDQCLRNADALPVSL